VRSAMVVAKDGVDLLVRCREDSGVLSLLLSEQSKEEKEGDVVDAVVM